MQSEYLLIGEITRPQGIGGEMRLKPFTDDPMRFKELETVYFRRADEYEPHNMRFVRLAAEDVVIIRMAGVEDADAAERLRGQQLFVDRAHAVRLPENADFIADLINCRVTDDEGRDYGRITDVMQPGGGDVYVINGPLGEVLIPALKSVVLNVDTKNGRMLLKAARVREVAVFED